MKQNIVGRGIPVADFAYLLDQAPPIIWRAKWNEWAEKLGLPFRRGTMQNLDSKGIGPQKVIYSGRIGYRREDLVSWLEGHVVNKRL